MQYLSEKEIGDHTQALEDAIADIYDFGYGYFYLLDPHGVDGENDCGIVADKNNLFIEGNPGQDSRPRELTDKIMLAALPLVAVGKAKLKTNSAFRLGTIIHT